MPEVRCDGDAMTCFVPTCRSRSIANGMCALHASRRSLRGFAPTDDSEAAIHAVGAGWKPKPTGGAAQAAYRRSLEAEVERLRAELAAATAKGAAEEREAVVAYLTRDLTPSAEPDPYARGTRAARGIAAACIRAGKHREEAR